MTPFRTEELISVSDYPTVGEYFGYPFFPMKKLSSPITPKENFLRFLRREEIEWIPDCCADYNEIYPLIVPDNVACGMNGGIDSFGVTWIPTPGDLGLPAMVKPGDPKLKSISDWKTLPFPDVDSWPWEEAAKEYNEKLDPARLNRAYILTSMFERMIALMDFAPAAMALIEEPEEVEAFLDKVTDFNISLLEHYKKYFHIDLIMMMDDWGHQRGAMFSKETHRKFFLPRLKRIVERSHELGVYFLMHSDGRADAFLPEMVEAGVDMWQLDFQATHEVLPELIEKYGDDILFELVWEVPVGLSETEVKEEIRRHVNTYCGSHNVCTTIYNLYAYEDMDLRSYFYEVCRKAIEK